MNQNQPDFKPVYILGAGASKMLGAPLVNDFLSLARDLRYKSNFNQELVNIFDDVFIYQTNLYTTRRYVGLDLNNIEVLFSILDMEWQVSKVADKSYTPLGFNSASSPGYRLEQTRENLISLIIETLRHLVDSKNYTYKNIIQFLAKPLGASFITLNYDTSIEKALINGESNNRWKDYKIQYGYDIKDDGESAEHRKILKLHGSANWIYCDGCKKFSVLKDYVTMKGSSYNSPDLHLESCKNWIIRNVILPPTWNKSNYLDQITNIWFYSIKEISLATHLFIIGYSFPRTDVFFNQLLTLGFRENQNLKKVIIINPDREVENLLKEFFDKHFLRDKVIFIPSKFEVFDSQAAGNDQNDEKVINLIIKNLKDWS
ncbi:MAG: hypothetical protein C0412_19685 [Flavobacterium sp.]|nr:hypothetical protein [Flavobacterium sp.]